MNEQIRTRFAPSPTGLFHIGSARTALFNWLYAKRFEGKFILRIEDTDRTRSDEKSELDIMDGLAWLGLGWDEGPETPDVYGPYRQSERSNIYKKYIDQLLNEKKAYKCYCTGEELETERKKLEEAHQAPKYSGNCRNLTVQQITQYEKEGRKPAIRFIVEGKKIKVTDLIKGEIEFDTTLLGDFIIQKSDGMPTFLLAGAIDDAEMHISHVIRGEDHLSNTPKQLLLIEALNLSLPEYAHVPMILNEDRSKMSKRKNPVSLKDDFKEKGYLPEAIINFLALLGWSPKADGNKFSETTKEIFTLEELINEFDLHEVGKSPAIFDIKKLDYLNGYYIRKLPLGELVKRCVPYLQKAGLIQKENELTLKAIGLVQERMKKLNEAPELTDFFFKKPQYTKDLLIPKKADQVTIKNALNKSYTELEKESDFSRDSLEALLRALAQKLNIESGNILWPIRVALTGKDASPGTFELLAVIGKEESLTRIKSAIDMLQ